MEFLENCLLREAKQYPLFSPQDMMKFVYQSSFGGGHLVQDAASSFLRLVKEYDAAKEDGKMHMPALPEALFGGYCRWPLLHLPVSGRHLFTEKAYLTALSHAFVYGANIGYEAAGDGLQEEAKAAKTDLNAIAETRAGFDAKADTGNANVQSEKGSVFLKNLAACTAILEAHDGDGSFPFSKEAWLLYLQRQYPNVCMKPNCGCSNAEKDAEQAFQQTNAKMPFVRAAREADTLQEKNEESKENKNANAFLPVSHSAPFRRAYAPCYRVLPDTLARCLHVLSAIETKLAKQGFAFVAIDGLCGSGKTSFANLLQELYGCGIVHMDDFFPPPPLRNAARRSQPGGNIHYERFLSEIVLPLLEVKQSWQAERKTEAKNRAAIKPGQKTETNGKPQNESLFSYRRFDCGTMEYDPSLVKTPLTKLFVIEGSYSMRPEFCPLYDLTVFLSCSREEQKARILRRNGAEKYENFRKMWIPLENAYFDGMQVAARAMLSMQTDAPIAEL